MITAKLLREWSACWDDNRIATHFGKRTELTPRDIATDTTISLADRVWVLSKVLWCLDPDSARYFAVECAERVLCYAGEWEDDLRGALSDVLCALAMPDGEERSQLLNAADSAADSAASAARSAADSAARSAADSAASAASAADSAASAARSAAYSAADSAAYAADSAAYAADSAADSYQETIDRAIYWLGEYADGWLD